MKQPDDNSTMPHIVPAFSGVQLVLFPGAACSILVHSLRAWHALKVAQQRTDPLVALFASRTWPDPDIETDDLYEIGTLARIQDFSERPCCGWWIAELEGLVRVRARRYLRDLPYREAQLRYLSDPPEDQAIVRPLSAAIGQAASAFGRRHPECRHVSHAIRRLQAEIDPAEVPGAVAELLLHLPVRERQEILEMESIVARLQAVLFHLQAHLTATSGPPTIH